MSRRKVVFQVISHFSVGGAQQVAINLSKQLIEDTDFHIITVFKKNIVKGFSDSIKEDLDKNSIIFHESSVNNSKIGILLLPFRLIYLVLKFRPIVVHAHTEIPDISIFFFLKYFSFFMPKMRLIRTIHNTVLWSKWEFIGKMVEKYFSMKGVFTVTISKGVDQSFKKFLNSHNIVLPLMTLIPNGVSEPSKDGKKFDGLVNQKKNILFAGRFERQKGIEKLCDIILTSSEPNFFHIIGDGSMKDYISTKLKDMTNFKIHDPYHDLANILHSFDYLVMPSLHEGLPLLTIESLLAKTPVVANNIPGLNETVPPNYPFLVENNSLEIYNIIFDKKLLPADYECICNLGYEYAREEFSLIAMQKRYNRLFFND
ncbi:glycosyltransferase family 4 protein [Pedobacter sp. Leaf250]|uniref:glycosyltransferase family 4 protein n=1 Tax=Pedobacter sp. Leaf250 TaxID=2876559 RepID=UPI001E405927|nr:glycosyltransferase family 4 protein [Pedobacter sp. Leaf250]